MTRIASSIAFLALISFAVGCSDNHQKPATRMAAQKNADVRADDFGGDVEKEMVQKKPDAKKGGTFVIIGNDDTPKSVNPSVKQGKAAKPAKPPAEPPKPEEPTLVVSGDFAPTKERAKEYAILAAVEKVHQYLLEQQPPVTKMPSIEMVRKMVIPHSGASEADAEFGKVTPSPITADGKQEDMYQVEIAVRVRPQHIRELRSRERSSEALWILAGLGGLAAVFGVFFKIDSWTKGYLTSWLVLGTVGAAALVGGMWWFAK